MGLFAKLKLKNFILRLGNGVLDSIPVVSTIKSNIESDHSLDKTGDGFGKLDVVRIIVNLGTVLISMYVAYQVIKGNLTLLDAKSLLDIIK